MSYTLPFVTVNFFLQRVTALTPAVVRARFTYDPMKNDPSAANDALNPANYTLAGAHLALVTAVNPVPEDPQSVNIYLNVPLAAGLWTLYVNPTVEALDTTVIGTPNSLLFGVSAIQTLSPINGGASDDNAAKIIRKHLPSSFVGRAWDGLIAALSLGDRYNWENAILAFDQLFKSTASGIYLDRRANDDGLERPPAIGMPDELFRRFAIKTSANKLTAQSILEVLEVFYGTDAVRAHLETATSEPFVIKNQDSLVLVADGRDVLEVVFTEQDFAQIGQARAIEVAAAITRQARAAGFGLFAVPNGSKVRIYSGAIGLVSTLEVRRGLAQNALRFSTVLPASFPAATSFNVTIPAENVGRFSTTSADGTILLGVAEGDYVNVTGPNFSPGNRGSFRITNVITSWNGASFDHSFDVENVSAVAETTILTVDANDFVFFRPTRARVHRGQGRNVIVAQTTANNFDVVLPATTQAVGRQEFTAAYLHAQDEVAISSVTIDADSNALVATVNPHGLTVGSHVILQGLVAGLAAPAVLAGNNQSPGITGVSAAAQTTLLTAIRSPDGLAARIEMKPALLASGDVLWTGGYDGSVAQPECVSYHNAGDIAVPAGVARGRAQKTYDWNTATSLPVAIRDHTATGLSGSFSDQALVLGGRTTTTATGGALLGDGVGAWAAVGGTFTPRFSHTATTIRDVNGTELVYIIGGLSAPAAAVNAHEVFSPTGPTGTITSFGTEAVGRFRHAAVAIAPSALLVASGGELVAGSPFSRNDCFAYDASTSNFVPAGHMSTGRMDFALVAIREGAALAIGGFGRNPINETLDRMVPEIEMFELATGRWRPAGRLRVARRLPGVALLGEKLFVYGGLDINDDPVKVIEVYDIKTGRWSITPSTAAQPIGSYGDVAVVDDYMLSIGTWDGAAVAAGASILVPGSNIVSAGGLNGEVRVASILDGSTFTFDVLENQYAFALGGTYLPVAAIVGGVAGPYVWNPYGDAAITAIEGTLQDALGKNRQYRSLRLGTNEALAFPDQPGWVALAYGTKNSVYPVKYLGRLSDDEIIVDFSFVMPNDVPAGAKVVFLEQKGPFLPTNTNELGSAYITASSAGRVQAQAAIENIAGAGITIHFTVEYPGDIGLGKAGYPATGSVISDKVAIWGGDEVDTEVAVARGES